DAKKRRATLLFRSTHAETDAANGFSAEAFFQFSQDVVPRNLLEFVVQNRLEHPNKRIPSRKAKGVECAAMNSLLRNFAHSFTLGARIAANGSERRGKRPRGQVCKRVPQRP